MAELLRKDQKVENTWDLESIYATKEDFWREFKEVEEFLPEIKSYQGKVKEGARALLDVLKTSEKWEQKLEQLFIYAHCKNDQDSTDAEFKELYSKTYGLYSNYVAEWSFFTPELLAVDESLINGYLKELEELREYRFFLEKINKKRPHTLDPEQERIIAMSGEALHASDETFGALNNTDVVFEDVEDKDGNKHTLTHGTYGTYMENPDRVLRKNTFFSLYSYFERHINTLASTLAGNLKAKKFYADTHKYPSTRNHALSSNLIPEEVYDNLVETVNKKIPVLHKYYKLHKKIKGLDELRLYDWKIKSFSNYETDRNLLSMILYEVIYRIMEKGGKPKDETGNFQYEIDKYGDNFLNRELAMKIANFQIENPDYGGSDWGGIWFYPTEKTLKLMKELNIGE